MPFAVTPERLLESGAFGFNFTTLLALIVMALVYFLAPCAGYQPNTRGALLAALWFLFIKFLVGLVSLGLALDAATAKKEPVLKGDDALTVIRLLGFAEIGLFALSLLLFLIGLSTLRRGGGAAPPLEPRRPYNDY
jgi:hypothetical protein